jgi:beta-phosphoglucomutase-like phosphatase (HAD superfamily)
MRALAAIIFDFDGVVADCQRGNLLPGAAAFVLEAARVVPLGIASGAVTEEIDDILHAHGLRDAFVAVVGADQTARGKPSPDPYLEALHRIVRAGHRVDSGRTVAIDDSIAGLVAARAAKLRCVGVGHGARQQELARHAELVIPELAALTLDTLDTLVKGL